MWWLRVRPLVDAVVAGTLTRLAVLLAGEVTVGAMFLTAILFVTSIGLVLTALGLADPFRADGRWAVRLMIRTGHSGHYRYPVRPDLSETPARSATSRSMRASGDSIRAVAYGSRLCARQQASGPSHSVFASNT